MIALIASVLLGFYIFLPEFLFKKLAFNFRVVTKTTKGRFEDIFSGAGVSLAPFFFAAFLARTCRFSGHWPFPIEQSTAAKYSDYRTVVSSLFSDAYFRDHLDATWLALNHVRSHQMRFLFWMYVGLALEIVSVVLLTYFFGSLSKYSLYRWTFGRIFLGRASHWEVLLTGFAFPRGSRPQVAVDAMTSDDHLYAGTVADYFLKPDGELSGLLLKDIKRFRFTQLEDDRKAGLKPISADYWTAIPGANFYLPADKIANLNIRYEPMPKELLDDVKRLVEKMDVGNISVSLEIGDSSAATETEESPTESRPEDKPPPTPER
jgi:hypothetical protein